MTYYGPNELAESFRTVRKNTLTIAQEIPEDKYAFRATPDTRSVAQLLTHIAVGNYFQRQIHAVERRTSLNGFDFPALIQRVVAEEAKPRARAEVIELLRSEGDAWARWLEGLSEAFLAERVEMPTGSTPPTKSRFEMLLSVKEHEMHHRGQLMVIERMLGIVPHLTREMQARIAQSQQVATAGA